MSIFRRLISSVVLCAFLSTSIFSNNTYAASNTVLGLPAPGTMVTVSPAYIPVLIKGMSIHPNDPLVFDFIVDTGHTKMRGAELKAESEKLIKYFMASLAVSEEDLWVNLSPYEKDRIVPDALGATDMGRDLLAQDYVLKQLTASLIYPEKELGKNFWDRVYKQAQELYGTTDIPVNTFNKVWVVGDKAKVFERNGTAFVVESHLKVMLEEDYLAAQKHYLKAGGPEVGTPNARSESEDERGAAGTGPATLASQVIRNVIIPELEKEVNQGKNFATLRQIVNSLVLASWYKNSIKESLLNQVYSNKSKVNGIKTDDPSVNTKIYQQYLAAYKKGVFNYIKEDMDRVSHQPVPRKYFSGGFKPGELTAPERAMMVDPDDLTPEGEDFRVTVAANPTTEAGREDASGVVAGQEYDAAGAGVTGDEAMHVAPENFRIALQAKLQAVHESLQPLLTEYYEAKAAGQDARVKELDAQINVIVDRSNVYAQPDVDQLSLLRNFANLDQFRASPEYAQYRALAEKTLLTGRYIPQFLFAGAATRLNRGAMYPLDIWKLAQELAGAKPGDAKFNYGMGPRQIIAYRMAIEQMAQQAGISPKEAMAAQRLIFSVNEDIVDMVQQDFQAHDFYGFDPAKVYFVLQPTYQGYRSSGEGIELDEKSESFPYGHGHNFKQLGQKGQAFTVSADGSRKFLDTNILDIAGDDAVIGTHRINDLTKFSYKTVVDVDKLALGMSLQAQGRKVVVELVNNPKGTQGGNAIISPSGQEFLLETSNAKGSGRLMRLLKQAGDEKAPYNAFRLLYNVKALKGLLKKDLPFNLRFKNGVFYLDAVTGDVTQSPEANTGFFTGGEDTHDFKEPANIQEAVTFLRQQDAELEDFAMTAERNEEGAPIETDAAKTPFGKRLMAGIGWNDPTGRVLDGYGIELPMKQYSFHPNGMVDIKVVIEGDPYRVEVPFERLEAVIKNVDTLVGFNKADDIIMELAILAAGTEDMAMATQKPRKKDGPGLLFFARYREVVRMPSSAAKARVLLELAEKARENHQSGLSERLKAEAARIKGGQRADRAALAQSPGGIDLNTKNMHIDVTKDGNGVKVTFDPAMLERFKKGDFTGVVPVILNITPIPSVLPLLGFSPRKEDEVLAQAGV